MQRLFTMFPDALPGIALLLLRLSVAGSLLAEMAIGMWLPASVWLYGGLYALVIMALLGSFTPFVALLCCILQVAGWLNNGAAATSAIPTYALDALALTLLGPGAYSIDCYWFGRRLIRPPSTPNTD